MPKITPFLWFDREAEAAAKFYVSIFKKNSKILQVTRYGDSGPGPKGSAMTVRFRLNGQEFVGINGGPVFKFTEAISFVVNCGTQKEIDRFWKKLVHGGQELQCGWLKDRYGLCWQIVPTSLPKLLSSTHPERSDRVMRAVFSMVKLDLASLQRAYDGPGKSKKPRRGR